MRVASATINFKLRTQKILSDGTSPIMLVVQWNGRKEKSTSFSCTSKQWDERNQQVKKTVPNFVMINKMLQTMKNDVIQRKLYFEQNKIDYNSSMLLEKQQPTTETKLFYNIAMNMCNERKLGLRRKNTIETSFNSLSNYFGRKDILITELDNTKLINYIKSLEGNIVSNTIINYVRTIFAVIQYAVDNEIISTFPNKAKQYLRNKHTKTPNHRALKDDDMSKLRNHINNMDGDITNRYDKKFALGVYLMSYTCFGIAPIDLLKLRQNQISTVEVNGTTYYKIETNRSKTNAFVKVFVDKAANEDLIEPFITAERSHFLPIFHDGMSEQDMLKESRNINVVINRNLKEIAEELGISKFTMYSARHSFASIAVKKNMPLDLISNGMGRSVQGISTYIKNLNTDNDLIKLTNI